MDLVLVFVGLALLLIIGGVIAVPVALSRRKRAQRTAPPQGWVHPSQQHGHEAAAQQQYVNQAYPPPQYGYSPQPSQPTYSQQPPQASYGQYPNQR